MTEERKQLYRELLYWAMIDMRTHTSWPSSAGYLWQWWRRQQSRRKVLQFSYELSNWLHNLALYSSLDFTGFKEEWFWRDYQRFRRRFPASSWAPHLEHLFRQLRPLVQS